MSKDNYYSDEGTPEDATDPVLEPTEEVFEGTELDWDAYLTEGLLPVSRVHIFIKKAEIKDRTNQTTGKPYKQISVECDIDQHEVLGDAYPGENKKPTKIWLNCYLSGKSAKRFRALYTGCTGHKMAATGISKTTGKPVVNMDAVVDEIEGLGCYTVLIWRKQDDDSFEEDLGWAFAQNLDDIRVPVNKFLTEEG